NFGGIGHCEKSQRLFYVIILVNKGIGMILMLLDLKNTTWSQSDYQNFLNELDNMGDEKYRTRAEKIVPTSYNLLGISMGTLKTIGKEISQGNPQSFLQIVGSENYEVVIIEGFVISNLKLSLADFETYCDAYLRKANAWSICDMVVHFKIVKQYLPEFLIKIKEYLRSDNFWLQRTGLVFLLKFYNTDEYRDEILQLATEINSDEYYVQMAQAWLFSAVFPYDQEKIYQIITENYQSKVSKLTVRRIKSLRHTTEVEKTKLTSLEKRKKIRTSG
ncbi:DNA alkylation repair protein, partial [Companilactobacillus nantensis]